MRNCSIRFGASGGLVPPGQHRLDGTRPAVVVLQGRAGLVRQHPAHADDEGPLGGEGDGLLDAHRVEAGQEQPVPGAAQHAGVVLAPAVGAHPAGPRQVTPAAPALHGGEVAGQGQPVGHRLVPPGSPAPAIEIGQGQSRGAHERGG